MNQLTLFLKLVFAVSLPLLLLSTNLRLAINTPALYEYGFDRYGVSASSGIDDSELTRVANGLVTYFNSDEELFNPTITRYGLEVPLFHENEAVHFSDVKDLVRFNSTVQWVILAYSVLFIFGMLLWLGQTGLTEVFRATRWGSALTLALMAFLGMGIVLGFDRLFLAFHLAFFNNDLWIAFSGDVMNILFPEMFFRDALAMVSGAMLLEAGLLLWLSRRSLARRRQAADTGRK